MKLHSPVDQLLDILATQGGDLYGGEAVTQLQHALQCAHLAERDQQPASLVVASLLHDIGHLIHNLGDDHNERGVDDAHEVRGERLLKEYFGQDVIAPIKLHVDAKRYLCCVDKDYHASLSLNSQQSLALQGGPFNDEAADSFISQDYAADAVALRRYDDLAKDTEAVTPELEHYRPYIQACMKQY